MNADDLKAFRLQAKLSQTELADLIGMKLRAYQELEAGNSAIRPRHWQALERVSLKLALVRQDIGLALPTIRKDALDYAGLMRGDEGPLGPKIRQWEAELADVDRLIVWAKLGSADNLASAEDLRQRREALVENIAAAKWVDKDLLHKGLWEALLLVKEDRPGAMHQVEDLFRLIQSGETQRLGAALNALAHDADRRRAP